jgi:hypothetical protein
MLKISIDRDIQNTSFGQDGSQRPRQYIMSNQDHLYLLTETEAIGLPVDQQYQAGRWAVQKLTTFSSGSELSERSSV